MTDHFSSLFVLAILPCLILGQYPEHQYQYNNEPYYNRNVDSRFQGRSRFGMQRELEVPQVSCPDPTVIETCPAEDLMAYEHAGLAHDHCFFVCPNVADTTHWVEGMGTQCRLGRTAVNQFNFCCRSGSTATIPHCDSVRVDNRIQNDNRYPETNHGTINREPLHEFDLVQPQPQPQRLQNGQRRRVAHHNY